jgi:trk system potassium uptake protein TrkH
MFIGASPGSCGGGIKTTTMTLVILSILNRFKMREDVNVFYRRIPETTLSRMISIMFFSIAIIVLFTLILSISEIPMLSHMKTRGQFIEILFEVVSAFGTVGLSTGITFELTAAGKFFITVLMYIGRLGPLTIALAIGGKQITPPYKYLQEDVMVG